MGVESYFYSLVLIDSTNDILLHGKMCIPNSNIKLGLVLYHGGQEGSRERFEDMQPALATHGIATLAIDFRGRGSSTGSYEASSVDNRLDDASAAYKFFKDHLKLDKVGILCLSLAADEVRLLDQFGDIGVIILIGPVAVSNQLTQISPPHIGHVQSKKTNTWSDSRVFNLLESFKGPKLVIYGEYDNSALPEMIRKFQKAVGSENIITIDNAQHNPLIINSNATELEHSIQIAARNKTIETVVKFLDENLF